jgi:hypothetical protein
MIRIPNDDSLAELRLTAFDVIFRIGDHLVAHWNAIDPGLLERARRRRIDVMAERSQRCSWRHPEDPGYVLKEPGSYKTILPLPALEPDVAKRLKGSLAAIGAQRDQWAHQTPALIGQPGPYGHLTDLARDALFASETLGFEDLVEPLRRLGTTLENGLAEAPSEPEPTRSALPFARGFRIGAPTDVPLGSRTAGLMGGRIWGDDGRPLALPDGETRTDAELARLWSRIVGTRDAKLWIAPDGRVIVEHLRRHWIIDLIGGHRPPLEPGEPLMGWVVDRCKPLLDTDGSIWDYVTGRKYFDSRSDVGKRLLAALPNGGPLQVTADGAVGARLDDSGETVFIGSLEERELEVLLR